MDTTKLRPGRRRFVAGWCVALGAYLLLAAGAQTGCWLARSGDLELTCDVDGECDDTLPCTNDFCGDDGFCDAVPADNSLYLAQVPLDCQNLKCQAGRVVAEAEPEDYPKGDPCIVAECDGMVLVVEPMNEGATCELGAGSGICTEGECVVACDASSTDECDDGNPCTIDGCNLSVGQCEHEDIDGQEAPGTQQTEGDCHVVLCIQGLESSVIDDTDVYVDGNPCTRDECHEGNVDNPDEDEGTPCGTALVCNATGSCVGCNDATDCGGTPTFCQAIVCTNETCGVDNTAIGTPLPQAQQNAGPCLERQCNGTGGVQVVNRPNTTPCDDALWCTGTDTCLSGNCSQHSGDPCPGPNGNSDCSETCNEAADACTANDPNGSPCNDEAYCNGADTCNNGSCSQHAGNPCPGPDGDGDCSETCDETADNCEANDTNGSSCDDNLFCNGVDTCQSGTCNHPGNPCPGADGDGDCSESCDETADNCEGNDGNGSICDDSLFCTDVDTCANGNCVGTGDPCPGPNGNTNCNESCDENAKSCSAYDGNGASCDDGLYCTGTDTCDGGSCSGHTGNTCDGPDTDIDCSESCAEGSGTYTCDGNDPNGSLCNNGNKTCTDGDCA